jgi:hypothetical protein
VRRAAALRVVDGPPEEEDMAIGVADREPAYSVVSISKIRKS